MNTLLWFDRFIPLDDSASSDGNVFTLASHEYLDFCDANQAYITVEYWAMGDGASDITLQFQRSATRQDNDDVFEDMLMSPLTFTRGSGVHSVSFGADGTAGDKYPRGIGRFQVTNGSITDWASVRLRISVALVTG